MLKSLKQQLKPLLKYLKPYLWMYTTVFLILLVSIGLNLLSPMVTRDIIDKALALKNLHLFIKLLMIYLGLYVLYGVLRLTGSYIFFLISEKVFMQLRGDVFAKLVQCDVAFFEKYQIGDLMSRIMNDIGTVNALIVSYLMEFVINIISFCGTFAMLFIINWKVALFVLLTIPAYMWVIKHFGNTLRVNTRKNREVFAEVNTYLQQFIPQIKIIQAYNRERRIKENFDAELKKLFTSDVALEIIKIKGTLFVTGISDICPFLVLLFSGLMIIKGSMSIGEWVAISTYLGQIFGPISALVNMNLNLNMALASLTRITEILEYEPQIQDTAQALDLHKFNRSIKFENVSLAYGEKKVLNEINFEIKKGERIAIVGETGEGKSTIIDLMLRYRNPAEGTVFFDGKNLKDYKLKDLRNIFSVVFQDASIFTGSILENIYLFEKSDNAPNPLEQAEIKDWLKKIELDKREEVQYGGKDLSGGQRQILSILRAIAKSSDIMVFDEPTSSQDSLSEKFFKKILTNIEKDKTIIIISHKFTLTTDVDRIILLKAGKIVANGSHEKLLKESDLYRELYEAQIIKEKEDSYAI